MSDILASFTSTFPGLYKEPKEASAAVSDDAQQNDAADDLTAQAAENNEEHENDTDTYRTRVKRINDKFEGTRVLADDLRQYLQQAQQQARESEAKALEQADQEFTPAWRNVGLPMKSSHLSLDPGRMRPVKLVNPKAIMGQFTQVKSKEMLKPPMTYEYNDTSIEPNYLNTTANLQFRKTRVLNNSTIERVQSTYTKERVWPHLEQEEITARIAESEARRREQDLRMPPSQYDAEKKIIASMHHKLNFLRNPRYPLPTAVKLLQSQYQEGPTWKVGGTINASATVTLDSPISDESIGKPATRALEAGNAVTALTLTKRKPPIKSDMTSKPDHVFVVEPSEVVFNDYEVGKVYTTTLHVRNVTQVTRNMRLFPPASQYFHISMPRLPTESSSIAPGMAAAVLVRFTPDSLADYDDEFAVDTATSRFSVALKARRPPPKLTLSQSMYIGEVLCGNRRVRQMPFANQGGYGRFRVIPAEYWPEQYDNAPQDKATVGAFEVWPLYYDLPPGEQVVLNVAFEPSTVGVHEEKLVLVCDNSHVRQFTLRGVAADVDIQLETIDGVTVAGNAMDPATLALSAGSAQGAAETALGPPTAHASTRSMQKTDSNVSSRSARSAQAAVPSAFAAVFPDQVCTNSGGNSAGAAAEAATQPLLPFPRDILDGPLWFGEVVPGSSYSRRAAVRNTTCLPFPFRWTWSSQPRMHDGCTTSGESGADDNGSVLFAPVHSGNTVQEDTSAMAQHAQHDWPPQSMAPAGTSAAEEADSRPGTATSQTSVDSAKIPKGKIDLVSLGLEPEVPFTISPSEGLIQPGELMTFDITFAPPGLSSYIRWAQLLVDKHHPGPSPDGGCPPANCDTPVLELGMEGVAAALDYDVTPKILTLPGALTPGQRMTRSVTIHNQSLAPADFCIAGMTTNTQVMPDQGIVPPLSMMSLTVTFTAGSTPGAVQDVLTCHMLHGSPVPIHIHAHVQDPQLELLTSNLDFGLVRLDGSEVRVLRFRNTSSTCAADWKLSEVLSRKQRPRTAGSTPKISTLGDENIGSANAVNDADCAQGEGGLQSKPATPSTMPKLATYLKFSPDCGTLLPSQEIEVQVICYGLSDGQHHSVVQLHSPGGAVHCLEAFAAVVTPKAVVSRPKIDMGIVYQGVTCRFAFTLRNLALLPLDFNWKSEYRPGQPLSPSGPDDPQGHANNNNINNNSTVSPPAEMKIRPEAGTLMPGEEAEIQVRLTPNTTGPLQMFGVCDIEGAPLPAGFVVNAVCRALDVSYDVMTPEQYERWSGALRDPRVRRRRDDVDNFSGMTHLPPEVVSRLGSSSRMTQVQPAPDPRHHVADFGAAVPLGDVRSMYVIVTNRTPIASSLTTWLDTFGVDDLQRITGTQTKRPKSEGKKTPAHHMTGPPGTAASQGLKSSTAAKSRDGAGANNNSRDPAKSRAGSASNANGAVTSRSGVNVVASGNAMIGASAISLGPSTSPSNGTTTTTATATHAGHTSKHAPIKLDATAEKLAPFSSPAGNVMMATRRQQQSSASALGEKGLAISVSPPSTTIAPWSRTILLLSAFNDMCGDYFDTLHVRVSELPVKNIPVRIGVSGTPLVVQQERVLRQGLADRATTWATRLLWGQIPAGVPLQKTFYVFNTGSLDMHLSWTMYRYQDDADCSRTDAKVITVKLEPQYQEGSELDLPPVLREDSTIRASMLRSGLNASTMNSERSHDALLGMRSQVQSMDGRLPLSAAHHSSGLQSFAGHSGRSMSGLLPPSALGMTQLDQTGSSNNGQDGADNTSGSRGLRQIGSIVRRETSASFTQVFELDDPSQVISSLQVVIERNAEPDTQPFVVEPAEAVIRGGESARFVVSFTSERALEHLAYLHGVQKVMSREGPVALKIWPTGDQGQDVGVMLSGTFHTYAGQPPAPLKPLRVDLSATTVTSRLEPDANSELSFLCPSTLPCGHHAYNHNITLSNTQMCPLNFKFEVEGPFEITSAAASAPQDVKEYRGQKGVSIGLPPVGQNMPAATWRQDMTYLPPGDAMDVGIRFKPPPSSSKALADDYNMDGALLVHYANGDVQRLPLAAHVMHPALEVRHAQQLQPPTSSSRPSSSSSRGKSTGDAVTGGANQSGSSDAVTPDGNAAAVGTSTSAGKPAPGGLQSKSSVSNTGKGSAAGSRNPSAKSQQGAVAAGGAVKINAQAPEVNIEADSVPNGNDDNKGTIQDAAVQEISVGPLPRDFKAALDFGRVHVQRSKPLEITLSNPTLVDAMWAVTAVNQVPQYCSASELPKAVYSHAQIGPFMVQPAQGCISGRGIKLPKTQKITITFNPTDNQKYDVRVVFCAQHGRHAELQLCGQGSYDETEEHQRALFQI